MNTSSNSLREDKKNELSDKPQGKIKESVHLYCESDRQSHNDYVHIPLAVSLKIKRTC